MVSNKRSSDERSHRPGGATASSTTSPTAAGVHLDRLPARGNRAGQPGGTALPIVVTPRQWLLLQVDGTPGTGNRGIAGLGIVVRNQSGRVLTWRSLRAPATTSYEAEYQALIAGLELMRRLYPAASVRCMSDNQSVIAQLCGRAAVRVDRIIPLHARACVLAAQFGQVEFIAIAREVNRLADALAWEALGGHGALLRILNTHRQQGGA